jgi:hypothetical protein
MNKALSCKRTCIYFLFLAFFLGCGGDDNGDDGNGVVTPTAKWQTIFEDNFNSTTMDPNWSLFAGDAENYHLTGTEIAMDDSDTYPDGPLFVYNDIIRNDRVRITCKVRTVTMSGRIEHAILIRCSADADSVYGLAEVGSTLLIVKITPGNVDVLATKNIIPMGPDETRLIYCEYNNGAITIIVRNESGSEIASITVNDPSPLATGRVGFDGAVVNSLGEFLYLDDFNLEKYE